MMNEEQEPYSPIDWEMYGAVVRLKRRKMGCKNFEQFSAAVYRRTRVDISPNVLKRIEQGRQQPTATQFIAINQSLFGESALTPHDTSGLARCVSAEYRYCTDNEGDVPDQWRIENLKTAIESNGLTDTSIAESALPDDADVLIPDQCDYWAKSLDAHEEGTIDVLEVGDMRVILNDEQPNPAE